MEKEGITKRDDRVCAGSQNLTNFNDYRSIGIFWRDHHQQADPRRCVAGTLSHFAPPCKTTHRCRSLDRQYVHNVVDPNFWTQKEAFLRWRAALKNKESQCPKPERTTRPA